MGLRANLTRLLSCRNISRYLLSAGNSNDGSRRWTMMKEGKTKNARWREGARRYRCESHTVSQDKEWVKFSGTEWMEYQRSLTLTFISPQRIPTIAHVSERTNTRDSCILDSFSREIYLFHILSSIYAQSGKSTLAQLSVLKWRCLRLAGAIFGEFMERVKSF